MYVCIRMGFNICPHKNLPLVGGVYLYWSRAVCIAKVTLEPASFSFLRNTLARDKRQ